VLIKRGSTVLYDKDWKVYDWIFTACHSIGKKWEYGMEINDRDNGSGNGDNGRFHWYKENLW
jgi:hypothetical protein